MLTSQSTCALTGVTVNVREGSGRFVRVGMNIEDVLQISVYIVTVISWRLLPCPVRLAKRKLPLANICNGLSAG